MQTWIRIFSLLIIVIALHCKVCILKLANNLLWNGKLKRMSNANNNWNLFICPEQSSLRLKYYLNSINSHQANMYMYSNTLALIFFLI